MKKYIYQVVINNKYNILVTADTSDEAMDLGEEFYLKNNFFTDKTVKQKKVFVVVAKSDIINL